MRRLMGICLIGLALSGSMARAETLEDVEKKIAELSNKHKSVQFKQKMTSDFAMEGMTSKMQSEGTTRAMKKGEKWLWRNETKVSTTVKAADQPEMQQDAKVLQVNDGEYIYTLNESADGKMANRMKAKTEMMGVLTSEQMKELRKTYDMKLLPDEDVDGKSAWVIETKLKKDAKGEMAAAAAAMDLTSLSYYRKADGILVKMVSKNKDGKTVQTLTTTDIKLDADMDPEQFKFKAPDGVVVQDMDAAATQVAPAEEKPAQKPAEEKKTETSSDESEKKAEEPKEAPKEEKKKKSGVGGLLKKLK